MDWWTRFLVRVLGEQIIACVSEHGKFIDHHYHRETVNGTLGDCSRVRMLHRSTCCRCGSSYLEEWDF